MNEGSKSVPKKSVVMITVLSVVGVVVVGSIVAYVVMNTKADKNSNNTNSALGANSESDSATTANSTETRTVPTGMKLYTNTDYGFTALYPETWPVKTLASTQKFGPVDATTISLSLYRPDIKKDSIECGITFISKNTDKGVKEFLDENFHRPSKTHWTTGRSDFAGGMDAVVLSDFDDIGSIGDLVSVGPYFESPDKKYMIYPLYSQEKTAYLTDIFGGATYTCGDFLNSIRWN
jgi:hypothetical protein